MTQETLKQENSSQLSNLTAYQVSVNDQQDILVEWGDRCYCVSDLPSRQTRKEKPLSEFFGPAFSSWRKNVRKVIREGSDQDWEHIVFCNKEPRVVRHRITRLGGEKALGIMELRESLQGKDNCIHAPPDAEDSLSDAAMHFSDRYLAAFSHEIKTPMNAILGLSRQALKTDLTSQQRQYISDINATAQYLMGILKNLLQFFKMDAGPFELESVPLRITDLFAVQRAMFEAKAREKGLELEFVVDRDVPPQIKGDPLRISEVLGNLLGNALKFTHEGGVYVRCELGELSDDSAYLRFSVCDTGIGLSEDQQTRVFDAFYQAEASVSRIYGGTGLGLFIAKKLVEKMNGIISVKSSKGKGTTFSFTCRVDLSDVKIESVYDDTPPRFSAENVLVVDDNPLNQEVIKSLLEELGLRVFIASNGSEALDILKKNERAMHFSLVLMDLHMPVMDGCRATTFMREIPELQSMPIIAMSAAQAETEKSKCLNCGMDGYLDKPIDVRELYKLLRHYLKEAA